MTPGADSRYIVCDHPWLALPQWEKTIMPEISRFFGIVIGIYWQEHGVPHFHAKYGEYRASFTIADLTLLEGRLPPRVAGLVQEWALLHREELMNNWNLASIRKPLRGIAPLE